jgi:hypothetical protein
MATDQEASKVFLHNGLRAISRGFKQLFNEKIKHFIAREF